MIARAKVAFSSALQETFGIAMQECINLGCVPCAPRRLSYPDVIPHDYLYDNLGEAVEIIHKGIVDHKPLLVAFDDSTTDIVRRI